MWVGGAVGHGWPGPQMTPPPSRVTKQWPVAHVWEGLKGQSVPPPPPLRMHGLV